jgi:hypothetical protein
MCCRERGVEEGCRATARNDNGLCDFGEKYYVIIIVILLSKKDENVVGKLSGVVFVNKLVVM